MSVDSATIRRVAKLARIYIDEDDVPKFQKEVNSILGFVEELSNVDVTNVQPMTSATPIQPYLRRDIVNDGENPSDIIANSPKTEDNYFVVPKMVE